MEKCKLMHDCPFVIYTNMLHDFVSYGIFLSIPTSDINNYYQSD